MQYRISYGDIPGTEQARLWRAQDDQKRWQPLARRRLGVWVILDLDAWYSETEEFFSEGHSGNWKEIEEEEAAMILFACEK